MANIKPAALLPLRFIDLVNINSGFDGDFAINQVQLSYQTAQCYLQKWQFSDTLVLQVPSYEAPTDLLIRDIYTNEIAETVEWTEVITNIIGETFRIYEIEYLLAGLPEGKYYTEFSFTDENNDQRPQQSEAIDLKETQDNTKLIRYRHSRNAFDVIFDTGIEFQIRVECAVKNALPKSERNTYNGQDYDITLLSATPYLSEKFWLGYKYGVPRWIGDKINRIQSVNQVYYDGIPYQVPSGAEYEWSENEFGNDWIGGSVDIRPVDENKFSRYETSPIEPENIFTPMSKRLRYFNIGANFSIPAVFNDHSMLLRIWIRKASFADITLLVGTTPGGSQIGSFPFKGASFVWEDTYLFDAASTLYLTGLAGANVLELQIHYLQTDVDDVDVSDFGGGGDPVPPQLGVGAVIIFDGTEAQLNAAFNVATGLGKDNTPWSDWMIWDGRNEVEPGRDPRGHALIPYKEGDDLFGDLDVKVGSKTVVLTKDQLPKVEVKANGVGGIDGNANGGGLGYNNMPKDKISGTFGNDEAHPNVQPSMPVIYIKKFR